MLALSLYLAATRLNIYWLLVSSLKFVTASQCLLICTTYMLLIWVTEPFAYCKKNMFVYTELLYLYRAMVI